MRWGIRVALWDWKWASTCFVSLWWRVSTWVLNASIHKWSWSIESIMRWSLGSLDVRAKRQKDDCEELTLLGLGLRSSLLCSTGGSCSIAWISSCCTTLGAIGHVAHVHGPRTLVDESIQARHTKSLINFKTSVGKDVGDD